KESAAVHGARRGGGGGGDSGDRCRWGGVNRASRRPVAELTEVVVPPAAHSAVREERAGVLGAGCEGGDSDTAHRHRSGGTGSGPVAELAFAVPPPAAHGAVLKERAGVPGAGCDRDGGGDSADCVGGGGLEDGPIAEL